MFIFDKLHPLTTDALTTDSDEWLDVYRQRPQGLEMDLLEYGNPTQHQLGRDKKVTYGLTGGHAPMFPPSPYAPAEKAALKFNVSWSQTYTTQFDLSEFTDSS